MSDAAFRNMRKAHMRSVIDNQAGRSNFPIIDAERENDTVVTDLGVVEVLRVSTDEFVAVAVRFAVSQGGDFQIQVGEYDFTGDRAVDVLRRAVIAYERAGMPETNEGGES